MKRALITGITGQDGAYLADFLLEKGYEVHGVKRRSSMFNTERIDHLYEDRHKAGRRFVLHYGDLTDGPNLVGLVKLVQPDEIYNLGAQSHVKVSFELPEYTANVDGLGTLRLLEAVRLLGLEKQVRFYQASTSELYGLAQEVPQNEHTPFYPRSPYACAKLYAYWITVNYREAYGMYACNGILFNHESPLRGETFVTRKITRSLSQIALGLEGKLYLGNLDAKRDWGHARDYVEMQWLMLQQEKAEDYVIATGQQHTVREFVSSAAKILGITIRWEGKGLDECGIVEHVDHEQFVRITGKSKLRVRVEVGQELVRVDSGYFRPTEVDSLLGDATKAYKKLGWKPTIGFESMIEEMLKEDVEVALRDATCQMAGFKICSHAGGTDGS